MIPRKKIILLIVLVTVCILLLSFLSLGALIPVSNAMMFDQTQIDQLHELGLSGNGVAIGLICTGIDSAHTEFDPESIQLWVDLIHNKSEPYDDADHGTHLAGLLVAQSSYPGLFSGVHLRSIAPKSSLVVVKALDVADSEFGYGSDIKIAQAIDICINEEVNIICLGFGFHPTKVLAGNWSLTRQKCEQAVEQGIIIVCPAGDDGIFDDGDVANPGILPSMLSVGSVTGQNILSSFSSKGHQYPLTKDPNKKPELVAPGQDLLSTRTYDSYGQMSGTCQAASVVTGITALLLEAYPSLMINQSESTVTLLKEIYAKTASLQDSDGGYYHDDFYGYGIIQAYDAYEALALEH